MIALILLLLVFSCDAFAIHSADDDLQCWIWNNSRAPQDRLRLFLTVTPNTDSETERRFDVHGIRIDRQGRKKPVVGHVIAFDTYTQLWRIFTPAGAWDFASEWNPEIEDFGNHESVWVTQHFRMGGHRSFFRGFVTSQKFIEPEQTGSVRRFWDGCELTLP